MNPSRWILPTLVSSTVVGGLLIVLMFTRGAWVAPSTPPEPPPTPDWAGPTPPPGPEEPPRLAVLLVFDQLRADYLTRWNDLFEDGGFHRLEKEGAWFQNCHYPYALTVTGPGHASLATGCSPDRHGIVTNEWFDRQIGKRVYCATDPRQDPPVASPHRLLVPTLADHFKAVHGKGRVVSLSFKDRSACLLGGQKPDACYWLNTKTGDLVTSTYYRDRPHDWVAAFNARNPRPAERFFAGGWTRLRSDLDYVRWSGPDDAPGEGRENDPASRVFPHPLKGYESLYVSPFGNDLLFECVRAAVEAEKLGRQGTPDLLLVSFSCNDSVGHVFGPDSQEVLDTTLRTDRLLRDLLVFLDDRVGKGRYTVVLSADHGVCPLPEFPAPAGEPVRRRVLENSLQAEAEAFLRAAFPGPAGTALDDVLLDETPVFYLNREWMRVRGLSPAETEGALGGWLAQRPETLRFYTRTRLESGNLHATDVLGQRVRKSFHKDRSGDVYLVTKPYHLLASSRVGTSHGTPHDYDTHVPLLVFGPGIVPGVRDKAAVTPQAAAPILAQALGLPALEHAETEVPAGLFRSLGASEVRIPQRESSH